MLPRPLPLVTADLPGLGAALKVLPEDFEVEELPAFPLSGEGEHLYLWIEKRGRDTPEVARDLAQALGVALREVGYAGLKDRQALTRQWFSAPVRACPVELSIAGVRLLGSTRHAHKLRTGVLRGNRFSVRLRGTHDAVAAQRVLEMLQQRGVPNWFGPQRFGRHSDNAVLGAALIGVGSHPLAAKAARDAFLRKLSLSALQSELFNRLLSDRVAQRRLREVEPGDVLLVPEDDRPFVAGDPAPLAARVACGEALVTGPMFGPRMLAAREVPGAREAATLGEAGLSLSQFERGGRELRGTRRPYRLGVGAIDVREEQEALLLSFDLPAGGYATSILRELARHCEAPEASDLE